MIPKTGTPQCSPDSQGAGIRTLLFRQATAERQATDALIHRLKPEDPLGAGKVVRVGTGCAWNIGVGAGHRGCSLQDKYRIAPAQNDLATGQLYVQRDRSSDTRLQHQHPASVSIRIIPRRRKGSHARI